MASEKETKQGLAKKSRLIVRVGSFLVSHSALVSVICCIAGCVLLLLLPVLAKSTYVSENALMPGSATPMFSNQDALEANRLVKDIMRILEDGREMEIAQLIGKRMEDVGAEVYYHRFRSDNLHFNPLGFFSSACNMVLKNSSGCTSIGISSVGIIRAPRGLAYSVFSLLSRVVWLAKDIVWLAADSRHDPRSTGIDTCFVNKFHGEDRKFDGRTYDVFRRAGTMAAALVVKVIDKSERKERDRLDIYAEASNGQMPNLDLINIVHYLAVHRQGLDVKVGTFKYLQNSALLKHLSEMLSPLTKLAQSLNPGWKVGINSADFVEGTATLASSMYYQALGVPTRPHGAFRDFQIDAITMELSPRGRLTIENGASSFLLRGGRLIEGVIRSVNNLLEKFHQSFFLYFLTAPNKFVSVGIYMIPFALLVVPLPIVAAALFSTTESGSSATASSGVVAESHTWNWLSSANLVFNVHLWAVLVSLLPYLISQMPLMNSAISMLSWISFSLSTIFIFYLLMGSPNSYAKVYNWKVLKCVTIAAASIGLCLMSIINFSTAQVGAMLLVPLCLMVRPLKKPIQLSLFRRTSLQFAKLVLAVLAFPPATFAISKGLLQGFRSVGFGDFWEWSEFLWTWNSATYLYVTLVHLPCWVLCMHILLHP
ncbi:hypothetical protein HPP92_013793 [Vanilla planifolia]|uniref:Glycosylphosphatidylinositol anchor attachment 1 protein n=1 Tax=Vanilla planifolia TaxID=51239 RepID=A0A835R030_VANPL|nr:hypothetical protein HPP92_013793 [Vanilla planifolia]